MASGQWSVGSRIRLVAIDLDGTLLSSQKTITPFTFNALRAVMERGVKVVLATARPPRSVRGYYQALGLDTPTINYNGALIWDEVGRKAILHTPLGCAVARRVIDFARGAYPEVLVSVEIMDKWYTDRVGDTREYDTETAKEFGPDFVGPIGEFLTGPITKLMLLGPPARMGFLQRLIGEGFRDEVSMTSSDAHLLQIMSPAMTKARALAKVAGMLGVTAGETMALGDAANDVEMLQWAGLAVVPGNAWAEAKAVADAVVPSNDEDGVGVALERFVLGEVDGRR